LIPEFAQYLLFVGFAALMLLLRLDAKRFSAAEWDTQDGEWRVWMPRISWYGAGLALALLVFALHPSPVADLNLSLAPDRGEAMLLGLVYGGVGIVAAFVLAIVRNGAISFPRPARYPGGVLTAVGTAFYDEFLFRGVILGLLLSLDLPDWLAVVGGAFIYAGAIRAGTGSRGILMLGAWLAIGVVGGFLVVTTAGIAAAFVGHAITRFALFMTMGQPERAAVEQVRAPTGGTGDAGAYVIPPRSYPRARDEGDGRGGTGPIRPA
jgi:Type II CAAX prenyl endopeptidase Rce1-like